MIHRTRSSWLVIVSVTTVKSEKKTKCGQRFELQIRFIYFVVDDMVRLLLFIYSWLVDGPPFDIYCMCRGDAMDRKRYSSTNMGTRWILIYNAGNLNLATLRYLQTATGCHVLTTNSRKLFVGCYCGGGYIRREKFERSEKCHVIFGNKVYGGSLSFIFCWSSTAASDGA